MLEDGSVEVMHWSAIEDLIQENVRFIDITDTADLYTGIRDSKTALAVPIPKTLTKERDALCLLLSEKIDKALMRAFLIDLTSFHTRYFKSHWGVQAVDWLWDQLVTITDEAVMKVSLERIEHKDWPQNSLIARIEPEGMVEITDETPRIVLSAHLDSTAKIMPMFMPAPGADDDGSGTTTILEVFRILSSHHLDLSHPIEFMFYSAEEAGLLGSQAIVKDYRDRGVPASVLHIDMDGWPGTGNAPSMAVITDNTSSALTDFIRVLAKRYTKLPIVETKCGYACSDHYSWTAAGYASAALFEGRFEDLNPHIHSSSDTVENIDFDHMQEFVKVAMAFALHMAA